MGGAIEGSEIRLKVELWVEGLSSFLILLLIGDKAWNLRAMKGAIKA